MSDQSNTPDPTPAPPESSTPDDPSTSAQAQEGAPLPNPMSWPAPTSGIDPTDSDAKAAAGLDQPADTSSGGLIDTSNVTPAPAGAADAATTKPLMTPAELAGVGGSSASAPGSVLLDEVPDDHTVSGVNSADGVPTIVDPSYRGVGDDRNVLETRVAETAVAANDTAGEAERAVGMVTVGSHPELSADVAVDAELVSMNTGAQYVRGGYCRVLLLDRLVTADGRTGGAGDYLVEDDQGRRSIVSQSELDERYIKV